MKRTDIKMTPFLESFLSFDLGHMNENKFTNKIKDINYYDDLKLDIYYPNNKNFVYPKKIKIFHFRVIFQNFWRLIV